jgi:hypothetical protein
MTNEWIGFLTQMFATVIGGALVIAANYLTHRRERRLEEERQQDRNSALFTAVFAVRNMVVATMNELAETNDMRLAKGSLKTALRNIESIIEKSPPETQHVMSAVYGISLALGELDALTDMISLEPKHLERRLEGLETAIEFFDLVASQDLTIMGDEELAKYISNPEDLSDAQAASVTVAAAQDGEAAEIGNARSAQGN